MTKTSISCEFGNLSQKQFDFGHKNVDFVWIWESFSKTIRFWAQKSWFRVNLGIFLRNNSILGTKTSISYEFGNLSQKQFDFGHKNIDFLWIWESFSETIRFWAQKRRFRANLGIFLGNNTILGTKKLISCEFGNLSPKQYDFGNKKVDFVWIWESFSETIRF